MGTMDMAASHMNRGCNDLFRADFVKQQTDTCDISHRIHGSHLVEMNLVHRHSVGVGFCLSDEPVYAFHILLHLLRKVQM